MKIKSIANNSGVRELWERALDNRKKEKERIHRKELCEQKGTFCQVIRRDGRRCNQRMFEILDGKLLCYGHWKQEINR
jgi:hypothetical protein